MVNPFCNPGREGLTVLDFGEHWKEKGARKTMSIRIAQDSTRRGAGTTRQRCAGSASEVSWKHSRSLASQEQLAATKEEEEAFGKLPKGERDRLIRVAAKIHTNTGHRNVEALAKQLRKLGAPLTSRAAMEKVHCDSCKETGRNPPSPVASLNSESRPWKNPRDRSEGPCG